MLNECLYNTSPPPELLYVGNDGSLGGARLSAMINSAMGVVAKSSDVFIDLDSIPEESVSASQAFKVREEKEEKRIGAFGKAK